MESVTLCIFCVQPVPFTRMIPGGMTLNKTIIFRGKVLDGANR